MTQVVKLENNTFFETVELSLQQGHDVKFPVAGNSMRPFLRNGDVVLIRKIAMADARLGMVLLARWNGGYVLHRFVARKLHTVVLAGDNNLAQREYVDEKALMAVVVAVYRQGKLISQQTNIARSFGLIWYHLRPLRWMLAKVKRIFK